MQKITLQPGEAVEINGAIIGMEIVYLLLDCQLGIDSPGHKPREANSGLEEYKNAYNKLIIFLSGEADSFSDKDKFSSGLSSINTMRDMWDRLRIPGTEVSKY